MSMLKVSGSIANAEAVIGRITRNVLWVCAVVLVLLILLICTDVFLRYAFNKPLMAAVEVSELMLPWIVFPALAYALFEGTHVRMTLVLNRLALRVQTVALIFTDIVGLVLFAALFYWGWLHFWQSFAIRELMEAAIPLPWWAGKLALPVGMFFFFLQFIGMLLMHSARLSAGNKE